MYPAETEVSRLALVGNRTKLAIEGGEIEVARANIHKDDGMYRIRLTGKATSFTDIHAVDKTGKAHTGTETGRGSSWSTTGNNRVLVSTTWDMKFNLKSADIKEFVITRVKEFYTDEIEFEFKNVPID